MFCLIWGHGSIFPKLQLQICNSEKRLLVALLCEGNEKNPTNPANQPKGKGAHKKGMS